MIITSWGKKAKLIGYIGIMKCPNCKNYTHFSLYELFSNIKLYFVTVAKYNKKRYVVCSICEAGLELNEEDYNALVSALPQRFNEMKTTEIWNYITDKINAHTDGYLFSEEVFESFITNLKEELFEKYGNEENLNEIITTYFKQLTDDDKAR